MPKMRVKLELGVQSSTDINLLVPKPTIFCFILALRYAF